MYSKVIFLAIVLAVASCQEHRYVYTPRHELSKEYKRYEHIPLKVYPTPPSEPAPISEEEHEESIPLEKEHQGTHGQPFLSQSTIHYTGQHETQDNSDEQVVPIYQYVSEHNQEANVYSTPPKFHTVRYTAPAPVHLDIPSIKLPEQPRPKPHYVPEELTYHAPAEAAHGHHPEIHSYESHDEPIDYYAYPKYQFEYKVEDTHTGDNKYQHEIRDGDVVKGVYGLHESDGSIRTVEYSSDKHSGFTAIVKHSTPNQHVEIATHHKN